MGESTAGGFVAGALRLLDVPGLPADGRRRMNWPRLQFLIRTDAVERLRHLWYHRSAD